MAKVNADSLEMETDVIRTTGSSLAAKGTESGTAAAQIIQRIHANEFSIGTGAAADNFRSGYNPPAANVQGATESSAKTLTDLGNSLTEEAGRYEEVDQRHRAAIDRIARA
jgi:hypothetical protein